MALLSCPSLMPAKGAPTHLVVLLHGYGADGDDLIGLAPHWQARLPTTAFVAPHAPDRVPGAPNGFQWFALTNRDPHEMHHGVASAAAVLSDFIAAELKRLNIPPKNLALAGFSQGTMVALHVGLKGGPVSPACIVGFSGLLAAAPPPGEMPVLLTHGAADQVIPASAMLEAANGLAAAGHSVQWHLALNMGHSIDQAGLEMAGEFIELAFAGKLARPGPLHSLLR